MKINCPCCGREIFVVAPPPPPPPPVYPPVYPPDRLPGYEPLPWTTAPLEITCQSNKEGAD